MTSPRHCTAPGCGKLLVRGSLPTVVWERRIYCNRECRAVAEKARWVKASRVCKGCGNVFHRKPDQELCDFKRRPYCSGECYQTSRSARAQRKKEKPPGRVAFVAIGNANLNKVMAARRIGRAPKGRFETVEEALSRGIIINRIVLTYTPAPVGTPVGSKTGWDTRKVGR